MKQFDLTTIYNKDRPLSWSAISSFEWNKGQWYRKYVLKELPEVTPELIFGKFVDTKIQEDPSFIPNLVRYPILQHKMTGTFNKIPLLGYADAYDPRFSNSHDGINVEKEFHRAPRLRDYKTGRKPWDQKRADQTGQLTMYLFMLYLRDKIQPEDVECYIDWLPTHIEAGKVAFVREGDIITFKTSRSMSDVLKFGQRIKDTWSAMEKYAAQQASMEVHDIKDWN